MGLFNRKRRSAEADGGDGPPEAEDRAAEVASAPEPDDPGPDEVSEAGEVGEIGEIGELIPPRPQQTIGDAVAAAIAMKGDRYEIALIHVETDELVRTGLLVSMRDLEVLGSAADHYSRLYENPERRYPQVLARRERARRIGRTLWRFAVERCGIEEADKGPARVHSA